MIGDLHHLDLLKWLEFTGCPAAGFNRNGYLVHANELFSELVNTRVYGEHETTFNADLLDLKASNFRKTILWGEVMEMLEVRPFNMLVSIAQAPGRVFRCRIGDVNSELVALSLTDVTPQATLEAKLAERASVLDKVIGDFPHMIAATDNDGLVRIWNRRCEEVTGFSADEMMGDASALSRLFPHPRKLKEALDKWNRREEDVIRHWNMEIQCKDGSRKIISWSVRYRESPIVPDLHTWAIGVDISREVLVENALRESEKRFQIISQTTNDAVYDWDLQKDQLWWGEGMTKIFGHQAREMENNIDWWSSNLHPSEKERVNNSITRAIESGAEFWTEEYLFRKQDGDYAYVLDRGFFIRNKEGRAVRMIGGMIDQSAQKAFERLSAEQHTLIQEALDSLALKYRLPLSRIVQIARLLSTMTSDRKELKELVDQLLLASHQLSERLAEGKDEDGD